MFASDLYHFAHWISTSSGTKIQDIRLHLGVAIREYNLLQWLAGSDLNELFRTDYVEELCTRSDNLSTAFQCLESEKHTVFACRKKSGNSSPHGGKAWQVK